MKSNNKTSIWPWLIAAAVFYAILGFTDAKASTTIIEYDSPVVAVDDCGRVNGTSKNAQGVYISPEECREIRTRIAKSEDYNKASTEALFSAMFTILAVLMVVIVLTYVHFEERLDV